MLGKLEGESILTTRGYAPFMLSWPSGLHGIIFAVHSRNCKFRAPMNGFTKDRPERWTFQALWFIDVINSSFDWLVTWLCQFKLQTPPPSCAQKENLKAYKATTQNLSLPDVEPSSLRRMVTHLHPLNHPKRRSLAEFQYVCYLMNRPQLLNHLSIQICVTRETPNG